MSFSMGAHLTTTAETTTDVATPAQILPNMCKFAHAELPDGQIPLEPLQDSLEEDLSLQPQDCLFPEVEASLVANTDEDHSIYPATFFDPSPCSSVTDSIFCELL